MSYQDKAQLATFPPFVGRVQVAMMKAAVDVAAEKPKQGEVYRLRRALAVNVLSDPAGFAARFAWAVITNPVIELTSTDQDLQVTVNSVWNSIAGVPPEDPPSSGVSDDVS